MTGLCLLVTGLPVSLFLTSLSQFFLVGSFFLEGNPGSKFRLFLKSPIAMSIVGIWLLHVTGLAWTEDLQEGLKDVRIKLPLLILPVVLAGSGPFRKEQFRFVLQLFVTTVVCASLIHAGIWMWKDVADTRDIYIFGISHIRFALFCCLSVVICQWLAAGRATSFPLRVFYRLTQLWLIVFLTTTASVTGIAILFVLLLTYAIPQLTKHGNVVTGVVVIACLVTAGMAISRLVSETLRRYSERKPYTVPVHAYSEEGNYYYTDSSQTAFENGFPVWVEICDQELSREWNLRSRIPYDSLDLKGQPVRTTLIRFLASKGMKKDAEHFKKLSNEEVRAVEKGIANHAYMSDPELVRRMKEVVWEIADYRNGGAVNGHSVTQRFEFWNAGIRILKQHPWFGTGTGDMPSSFRAAYADMQSRLEPSQQLRSHNQFLAIGVAFGAIGLVFFIIVLSGTGIVAIRRRDVLLGGFWLIAMLSMLTEDTLETQPGATFFALFISLFLFSRSKDSKF
jgi:hypothetical protein